MKPDHHGGYTEPRMDIWSCFFALFSHSGTKPNNNEMQIPLMRGFVLQVRWNNGAGMHAKEIF